VTSRHPPVENWTTDFDHTDPAWVADPYPIWEDLRQRCPVAHSDRYGGTWLPVTHELVSEVAYDTEHFTSRSVVVSEERRLREPRRGATGPGKEPARGVRPGTAPLPRIQFGPDGTPGRPAGVDGPLPGLRAI
jgi:hypothetical protein